MNSSPSSATRRPFWKNPAIWLTLSGLLFIIVAAVVVVPRITQSPGEALVAGVGDVVVTDQWSATISDVQRAETIGAPEQSLQPEGEWLIAYGEVRNFSDSDVRLAADAFVLYAPDESRTVAVNPDATLRAAQDASVTQTVADPDGLNVLAGTTAPLVLVFDVPAEEQEISLFVQAANSMVALGAVDQIALVSTAAVSAPTNNDSQSSDLEVQDEEGIVVGIIGGDVIEVELDGRTVQVRYIGTDAPLAGEPYYEEARESTETLLLGQSVRLERDVSETDRQGRLLRYVFTGDEFANGELVRQGYALATTFPPNVRYRDELLAREREARQAGRGIWSTSRSGAPPTPQADDTARPRATPSEIPATTTQPPATATRPRTATPEPVATSTPVVQSTSTTAPQPPATTTQLPATEVPPPPATATVPVATETAPPATVTQPPAATPTEPAPAATETAALPTETPESATTPTVAPRPDPTETPAPPVEPSATPAP